MTTDRTNKPGAPTPPPTADRAWGGRFDADRNEAMERLNASLAFDWRLAPHDLWQNRVYADELTAIGVMPAADREDLTGAFETVETELKAGTFPWNRSAEDVHMNLEARLTELAGDAGRRIHTGRSRNDQVATVFRLWLRDALDLASGQLRTLVHTTLDLAERHVDLAIPGYTHLQRAQIVSFGHHLHAYAEMLTRDLSRAADLRRRLNTCPLGSGALAGSPYPLDRERLAAGLKFHGPTRNSMDATSDRDFVVEFLGWAGLLGLHLSRWAEDLILWMSAEFGWVRLPDAFCTGSSIMPQKKNPDLAELVRGKAGRLLGSYVALATVLKGLPLTYNKDLQEDKEPAFDAAATVHGILAAWTPMVAAIEPVPERMAAGLQAGHLLATDLADYLVRERGMPFRDAHHVVGRAVRAAEDLGVDLSQLAPEDLQAVDPALDAAAHACLDPVASLNARRLIGGPAPDRARRNIAATRQALDAIDSHDPELVWAFELDPPAAWAS